MSDLTVSQRAIGAVVGGLVADAAAMPIHWIYDVAKLDDILSSEENPEFLPKSHCPFYTLATGKNSGYGDQCYALLLSLVECKGYDKAHYKQTLSAIFGPGTDYDFDLGRPLERKDYPISAGYRNGSIKGFLKAVKEGKESTGQGDSHPQADGFCKVAPLVALYAGSDRLPDVVEEMVRVTQDDDVAVACSIGAARILEQLVLNGAVDDVVTAAQGECSGEVVAYFKEAGSNKAKSHREAVKHFGSSCSVPGNFKNCVHLLTGSPGDFLKTVRSTMTAGGDNCSRGLFIGSAAGARCGLTGIPSSWISRTTRGSEYVSLAERLVSLRK